MNLLYDEAKLHIISYLPQKLSVWTQSEECYKCDFVYNSKVIPFSNTSLVLSTAHNVLFQLRNVSDRVVCSQVLSLKEHGVYSMNISRKNLCPSLHVTHEPDRIYNALYMLLGIYIGFLSVWLFGKIIFRAQWLNRVWGNNPVIVEMENDLGSPNSSGDTVTLLRYPSATSTATLTTPPPLVTKERVRSLDVLRGICICFMVFINYGGGQYAMFEHSAWNGMTIADFIFPWFVWIVGVSLTFSLCSKLRSGSTRAQLFLGVVKRSFYLIVLGLIVGNRGTHNLSTLRYMGPLQRIGVAYFFVASVETFLMRTQPIFTYDSHGKLFLIRDLIESWPQWCFTVLTAILHVSITFLFPVPNCPLGYVGPGGKAEYGTHFLCTGGVAGYIDRKILGSAHMYANPTCKKVYGTVEAFDPEGLLGTLNTIVLMYLGVYAGRVMLCFQKTADRIKRWLISAIILGLAGGLLCDFSQEEGFIPLNKNLWSLSLVCVSAAAGSVLLAVFLAVVDHYKVWSGSPFHQAGKNAIFIYIGHILTQNLLPWSWEVHERSTHVEFTFMNAWGALLWMLIAVFMYAKRCFFSV